MRAEYDTEANAISIDLLHVDQWDAGDDVHERGNVGLSHGRVANVELLYPDLGVDQPLAAIAARYDLDLDALRAAAQAALTAPDRPVVLDVLARAAA